MDNNMRSQLIRLKEAVLQSEDSELQVRFRELLVTNLDSLLKEDATNHRVKDCLRGGVRSAYDSGNPPEGDPILILIGNIYDSLG